MFFSSFGAACPQENDKNIKEKDMYKKYEMELAGRTLRVDVGRVAKQANGARPDALWRYDCTVYCDCFREAEGRNRFLPAERRV